MRNVFFIASLLLITSLPGMTQKTSNEAQVTFSDPIPKARTERWNETFGQDKDGGIYVLKSGMILEHYDKNLSLKKREDLAIKYNDKYTWFENVALFNDQIFIFCSFRDKKLKKRYLFYQVFDTKTFKKIGELKKLTEFTYKKKRWDGTFDIEISDGGSKLMVYYNLPRIKGDAEKLGFQMYNSEFNKIWESEFELPYIDDDFVIKDYFVDDKGNAYLTGLHYESIVKNSKNKRKRTGKANYRIIQLYEDGNKTKDFSIDLPNRSVSEIKLKVAENGDLVGAGFYDDTEMDGYNSSINGCFYILVDGETKKIKKSTFKEFDWDTYLKTLSERQVKKAVKKKEKKEKKGKDVEANLYSFYLDDLIIKKDGGVIMVAEQYRYWTTRTSSTTNGVTTYRTNHHYLYGDLFAVDYNQEGDINWSVVIPKLQKTTNDSGYRSSYITSYVNGKLYLVYNDNIKNIYDVNNHFRGNWIDSDEIRILKLKNMSFKKKTAIVAIATIDADGRHKKEILYQNLTTKSISIPMSSETMDDGSIILLNHLSKGKKYKIAAIKFGTKTGN